MSLCSLVFFYYHLLTQLYKIWLGVYSLTNGSLAVSSSFLSHLFLSVLNVMYFIVKLSWTRDQTCVMPPHETEIHALDGQNDCWWRQLQLSPRFAMERNKLNSCVNETANKPYDLWNSKCSLVNHLEIESCWIEKKT